MLCNCGKDIKIEGYNFCPYCGKAANSQSESAELDQIKRLVPITYLNQIGSIGKKLASERRIVTIMFIDIVGSTAMSESRDPEEIIDILNAAFKVICKPIQNYQGTIARFMGDGLLCFFGAPESHKDDPFRACSAALEIIDNIKIFSKSLKHRNIMNDFSIRIGINTDLVVVGEVGTHNRVEYTAMGDGINIAARLESKAESNMILISRKTKVYIDTDFITKSVGVIPIKGISQPIEVFELIQKRDQKSKILTKTTDSPFIGRELLYNQVLTKVKMLSDEGGSALTVTGEAGIGKTRLLEECYLSFPPKINCQHINCSTSSQHIKYHIINELLEHYFTKDALDDLVENVESKNDIFNSYADALITLNKLNESVIIIDDFQWVDSESLFIIKKFIEHINKTKTIIILLYRLENEKIRSFDDEIKQIQLPYCLNITLSSLNDIEVDELYKELTGQFAIPPNIKKTICESSNGNPFFLHTLIKSVLEPMINSTSDDKNSLLGQHVSDIKIPRSLQGAVMSRVDQLHPYARMILKYASAMDNHIETNLLKEVFHNKNSSEDFETHFTSLLENGFIKKEIDTYSFTNKLEAESIYKSLLRTQRDEIKQEIEKVKNNY